MPHQKKENQGARTWRDVRAEAVKAGRLNEDALQAHKGRMLAEEYAYAKRQQNDESSDA